MSERVLDLTGEVLEASGSLVERGPDGGLEAVLTPEAAAALGTPEAVRLLSRAAPLAGDGHSTGSETATEGGPRAGGGLEELRLGVEDLPRLAPLFGDRGRAVELWTGPLYLKREGLAAKAREKLSVADSALRFGEPEEGTASWLRIAYRWTAISEEKREGLMELVLNERTGAPVPEMLRSWSDIPSSGEAAPPPQGPPFPLLRERLARFLEKRVDEELKPFVASLRRRLEKDARRARDYFEGVVREIRRKAERRRLQGEELEMERRRIRATEAERERKLAGLAERYSLSVKLRPLSVERAIAPVSLVPFTVMRKDRIRRAVLIWNPFLKELEPLPCDACGEPAWGFSACREAAHLLCRRCGGACASCGKALCPACRPGECPCVRPAAGAME